MLKNLLGKRLRKMRKVHGLTQKELSKMIGLSVPSIGKIETGKTVPVFETFIKLTEVYADTAVEDILCDFLDVGSLYRIKDISARIDSLPEAEREYLYDAARYFVSAMPKEGEADD